MLIGAFYAVNPSADDPLKSPFWIAQVAYKGPFNLFALKSQHVFPMLETVRGVKYVRVRYLAPDPKLPEGVDPYKKNGQLSAAFHKAVEKFNFIEGEYSLQAEEVVDSELKDMLALHDLQLPVEVCKQRTRKGDPTRYRISRQGNNVKRLLNAAKRFAGLFRLLS